MEILIIRENSKTVINTPGTHYFSFEKIGQGLRVTRDRYTTFIPKFEGRIKKIIKSRQENILYFYTTGPGIKKIYVADGPYIRSLDEPTGVDLVPTWQLVPGTFKFVDPVALVSYHYYNDEWNIYPYGYPNGNTDVYNIIYQEDISKNKFMNKLWQTCLIAHDLFIVTYDN